MGPRQWAGGRTPRGARRRTLARAAFATALAASALLVATPAARASTRVLVDSGAPLPKGAVSVPVTKAASFAVVLTPRNDGALQSLLADVTTPSSPLFRHYLTEAQYVAEFAPTPATVRAVQAYFTAEGLTVHYRAAYPLQLNVTGSSTGVTAAFATPLRSARVAGRVATEFAGDATLPASIARDVGGIYGLSSVATPQYAQAVRPSQRPSPRASAPRITTPGTCAGANADQSSSTGSFVPDQQAAAYGLSAQWANGDNGAGQTIGVYELANYVRGDVTQYDNCFGLSPALTVVNVDGGPRAADDVGGTDGPEGEADLDIEEASALAPGAAITVYQGTQVTDTGALDVYAAIARDDVASVVTTSWGGCELEQSTANDIAAEAFYFNEMALQGQSVVAAAGDSGSSDCWDNDVSDPNGSQGLAVDDPASQPTVTSVGGLTVSQLAQSSPPRTLSETVWNGDGGAGGGGVSRVWTVQPSWQTGDDVPVTGARMVPDLSVMADPDTGFIEYTGGFWNPIGGTSIGAPLVAALIATADQACGVRLGEINPALYAMASRDTGFDDVTRGSNALYQNDGVYGLFHNHNWAAEASDYDAGPGYDLASGLGSPDPATFIPDLCTVAAAPANSTLAVASAGDVATGAVVTVTVRDATDTAIANAYPVVTATESGATPAVTPLSAPTNSTGTATYLVDTTSPGTVTVSAAMGDVPLGSTPVTFTSSLAVLTAPFARLGAPSAADLDVTNDGEHGQLAVATTSAHAVLQALGDGPVENDTTRLGLGAADGAPAASCASTCEIAVDVGGDVDVILYATSAHPALKQLALHHVTARNVPANSLAIAQSGGETFLTYRLATGELVLVQWRTNAAATYTDLTATLRLAGAAATPSIVAVSASGAFIAVRLHANVWLLRVGATHSAENVDEITGYNATGSAALTGSPALAVNASTNELELAATSTAGALEIFSSTASAPHTLIAVRALVARGATAVSWLPGSTAIATAPNDVLAVVTHQLRLFVDDPNWTNLAVAALTSVDLDGPGLTPGATTDVTAAGAVDEIAP